MGSGWVGLASLLYVKHLLQLGYRVLLFDVDQVWTANPFDFIDRDCSADLHTQNDGTLRTSTRHSRVHRSDLHIAVQHTTHTTHTICTTARGAYALPCMGFMYLNPTPALRTLWDAVRVEHSLRVRPHVVPAGSLLNRSADACLHLQTRTRPYTESATEQAIFTAMSTNLTRTSSTAAVAIATATAGVSPCLDAQRRLTCRP